MSEDRPKPTKVRSVPKLRARKAVDADAEKTASWMDEFRNEDSFAMRPVYAVILAVTLIAFVSTLFYPTGHARLDRVIDRFGANVTTEGLAIFFTLVFVDRFLEQQDRRRRLRGSIRALKRASIALERMIDAWAPLIAGTLEAEPSPPPPSIETLFAPHYTENLMSLDFQRPRSKGEPDGPTWIEWSLSELRAGLDVLSDVGLRYSIILDSNYIEAIDHLIDDDFIAFLEAQLERPDVDLRTWRVALNTARGHREGHFTDLVRMLKVHNSLAREAGQVRTRSAGPRTGLLGVELAPDHDLRAPWRIERDWWRQLPAARSLRMSSEWMEKGQS
jgi:hypothetical protein